MIDFRAVLGIPTRAPANSITPSAEQRAAQAPAQPVSTLRMLHLSNCSHSHRPLSSSSSHRDASTAAREHVTACNICRGPCCTGWRMHRHVVATWTRIAFAGYKTSKFLPPTRVSKRVAAWAFATCPGLTQSDAGCCHTWKSRPPCSPAT